MRLICILVECKYEIYLHNQTLSANEEKCEKADLDTQTAMSWAKADVEAYGRGNGLRTWRVLIV